MKIFKTANSKKQLTLLYVSNNEGTVHFVHQKRFNQYLKKRKNTPIVVSIKDTQKEVNQEYLECGTETYWETLHSMAKVLSRKVARFSKGAIVKYCFEDGIFLLELLDGSFYYGTYAEVLKTINQLSKKYIEENNYETIFSGYTIDRSGGYLN